jgi:hypothetical protein
MTTSWVIVERATGNAVLETFSKTVVDAVKQDKYKAVPIREYLASLNHAKPEGAKPV